VSSAELWRLPEQEGVAEVLRAAAAAGQVSHAWAFLGPPGVGQREAGRALAAALNCAVEPGGCGACDICRRCVRGAFPSLWEFAPVGAAHRVADVREQWLPAASHSAVEGDWKVLHVADADRLNEAAANAFLKGLEEPPPRTVWLLDVADPGELPDTIVSRCRVLRFSPWGIEALRAEAARLGIAEEERELAARLAQGSPRALARFADGGLDDVRRHRDLLRRLREEGQGVALLAAREVDDEAKRRIAAQKAAGKDELAGLNELYGDAAPRHVVKQVEERLVREERESRAAALQAVLDDLLSWVRDALLVGAAAGGTAVTGLLHVDAADALRADAAALGPAKLLRAGDLLVRAKEDLELNLQQALALEALFLDLAVLALPGSSARPVAGERRAGVRLR
jgi:DNA polymerase-3 subunit delta'